MRVRSQTTRMALFLFAAALVLDGTGASSPVLDDLQFLPGDAVVGPAWGDQSTPDIASGGEQFLAVWSDARAYEGKSDIYGIRLDAEGFPIASAFAINQDDGSQTQPLVAWNGENWLVVFLSEGDLAASRVAPDGTVLDPSPIVLASPGANSPHILASDGSKWAVVWAGVSAGNAALRGARIGADGTVLDPGGIVILPETGAIYFVSSMAYSNDRYLLVWPGASGGIVGLRLEPTLHKIDGAPMPIAGGVYFETSPNVAGNGSEFYMVWTESDNSYWVNQIMGSRVSLAGVAATPAGVPINQNLSGGSDADVSWDGTQWIVAWTGAGALANRISANGSILDGTGIQLASSTAHYEASELAIAGAAGGGAKVVWRDYRNHIENDVWGSFVHANGTANPDAVVGLGAPTQQSPRLVWNGAGYTMAFLSLTSSGARILVQRLDVGGVPIDLEPIEVAAGSDLTDPGIAWSGERYLVTWRTRTNVRVWCRRLAPDLSFQDPVPTEVMIGDAPAVAALGDVFLVVVQNSPVYWQWRDTFAQRIDGATGAKLGGLIGLAGGFAWGGNVGTVGDRWLLSWEAHYSHNSTIFTLVGAWVTADGSASNAFGTTSGSGWGAAGVEIASHPLLGAIAYASSYPSPTTGEIYLMRVDADGTFLDGYTGIPVTGDGPGGQYAPGLAWNGAEFVTAYQDTRASSPYAYFPKSDIYASRITAGGTVLDGIGGFPVETTAAPEREPAVAGSDGNTLVAASHLRGAPFSALRIGTRMLIGGIGQPAGPVYGLVFGDPTTLTWSEAAVGMVRYDVLRGDLTALHTNRSIGDASCIDDDQPMPGCVDAETPLSGRAFYYLVRADSSDSPPGTYDASGATSQAHSRDDDVGTQGGADCSP